MPILLMPFTKPAIDIDAQIALLRARGLTITDEARARHYLSLIGYYRLSGYALVFQVNYNADGSHLFHPSANLGDILDLYIFDRKLRLAVLDALERIEVAIRASLSHEMSMIHGTHWFMDAEPFVSNLRPCQFSDACKKGNRTRSSEGARTASFHPALLRQVWRP